MEKYIRKLNDKLLKMDEEKAKKKKKVYRTTGYVLLGIGLAGFVALFIAFMVLFFKFNTQTATTCWFIAIPFLLMLVPGSVLARVGDVLKDEDKKREADKAEKNNKKK